MATIAPPITIPIPVQGKRADLDRLAVPPEGAYDLENWILDKDGRFVSRRGFTAFGSSVSERPTGYVQYFNKDGSLKLVKGTNEGWFSYNIGTDDWDDITAGGNELTASAVQFQVFRVFQKAGETLLIGTNEADALKKWDGDAATYSDLAGSPPRAKAMMSIFDRLVLGNLLSGGTISPVAIDVSANKDPESGWASVLTLLLADTTGSIVTMQEIGNLQGVIYTTDSIHRLVAQGDVEPFRQELIQAKIKGPASPACVVEVEEGLHLYLAADASLRRFDGTAVRIFSKAAHAHIAGTADEDKLNRSWGAFDRDTRLAYFVYVPPGGTNPSQGVAVDVDSGAIYPIRFTTLRPSAGAFVTIESGVTIGELVGTIGEQEGVIGDYATTVRRFIVGEVGGQSLENKGTQDDGVDIPLTYESGLNPLGEIRRYKDVQESEHLFAKAAGAQTVDISIGSSEGGENPTYETAQSIDIGNAGPYILGHRLAGKMFSMKIEASASQEVPWRGSVANVVNRGLR